MYVYYFSLLTILAEITVFTFSNMHISSYYEGAVVVVIVL